MRAFYLLLAVIVLSIMMMGLKATLVVLGLSITAIAVMTVLFFVWGAFLDWIMER